MKQNRKTAALAIAVLVLVLLAAGLLYWMYGPKTAAGQKEVTIQVLNDKEKETEYEVKTDAQYLKEAMDDAKGLEYSGEESDYGLMVDTVNGLRADYEQDGAYWSFSINGEYCNYGIDQQPVQDGDQITIAYTQAE